METVLVAGALLICGALIVRHMLRSLGIGIPGGKPDCGCGTCAEKKGRKA